MNGVWLPSHVHGRASRAAGSQEVKPKLTASAQLTPILYLPAKSARRRTSASPRHEVNLAEALGARPCDLDAPEMEGGGKDDDEGALGLQHRVHLTRVKPDAKVPAVLSQSACRPKSKCPPS